MTQHKFKKPPKFFLPLSPAPEALVNALGKAFDRDGDILQAFAPFNAFFFRNPEHIKKIYADPETGQTKCPMLLMRVKWVMGPGAYIREGGAGWKERRGQVQPLFNRPMLAKYTALLPDLLKQMFNAWDENARQQRAFDLRHEIELLITRFNFCLIFSKHLTDEENSRIVEATHYINLNFLKPGQPLWPLPSHIKFRRSWEFLKNIFLNEINGRRGHADQKQDVLTILMGLRHAESNGPWSEQDIAGELASIYFGASVVSTTLSWGLYLLSSHPAIQEQLAEELKGWKEGDDVETLKYLGHVMEEVLRLYPPSWAYPRWCKNGMQLDDYHIPKNSLLLPAVYHVQRHPGFWTDPHDFHPQRWEKGPIEHGAQLPFGRGPRVCLGSHLAPVAMKTVLAFLFKRYRLTFVPQGSDAAIDFGFEMHPKGEIRVQAKRL